VQAGDRGQGASTTSDNHTPDRIPRSFGTLEASFGRTIPLVSPSHDWTLGCWWRLRRGRGIIDCIHCKHVLGRQFTGVAPAATPVASGSPSPLRAALLFLVVGIGDATSFFAGGPKIIMEEVVNRPARARPHTRSCHGK
jgi:hypothetical protein